MPAAPGRTPRQGGASTLFFVVGTRDLPTPGHAVELRRKAPQRINQRDLLTEEIVTPPSGAVAQVITPVEVRYDEKAEVSYDAVTILPHGVTVHVEATS